MKVLLAVNNPPLKATIKEILTRSGYEVIGEAENAAEVLRKARSYKVDLVIMDAVLEPGKARQAAMILEEDNITPVLMLANEGDIETREFTYVLKPVTYYSLIPAIQSALLNFTKRRELKREVEYLRSRLATRKVVEKAKGVLMKKYGLDEEEAHKLLQKMSMDRGIPIKAVAEALIASE